MRPHPRCAARPLTRRNFPIAVAKDIRVNDRIRVPQVRVIGGDGEQIGILNTRDALQMAQERGLDLVEVSPTSRPPVCRIMDFGKYKYEQNKRAQKAKQKTHVMQQKEVKLRPKIEEHDFMVKVKHAREFLEGHDRVKLTCTFRGRELAHSEIGLRLLQRFVETLSEVAQVETTPRMEGRSMIAVLVPRSGKATGGVQPAAKPAEGAARPAAPQPAEPPAPAQPAS